MCCQYKAQITSLWYSFFGARLWPWQGLAFQVPLVEAKCDIVYRLSILSPTQEYSHQECRIASKWEPSELTCGLWSKLETRVWSLWSMGSGINLDWLLLSICSHRISSYPAIQVLYSGAVNAWVDIKHNNTHLLLDRVHWIMSELAFEKYLRFLIHGASHQYFFGEVFLSSCD